MAVWADIFVKQGTAAPTSTASATVSFSSGTAAIGNKLILCVVPAGSADVDTNALTSAGWSLDVTASGWKPGYIFSRSVLTSGISGVTVNFTAANRPVLRLIELQGVAGLNRTATNESAAATGTTATTTVADAVGIGMVFGAINGGEPTYDTWDNSFTGLGSLQSQPGAPADPPNRIAMGVAQRVVTATGAYGSTPTMGGTGGPAVLAPAGMIAVYQVGAAAPIVNAGANAAIPQGGTFNRTATEDPNGGAISARAWTITAGPAGVGSTIGTAASLSWTPSTAGDYTLQYAATNSGGTGTDTVDVAVVAPIETTGSNSPIPVSLVPGTWRSRIRAEGPGGVSAYSAWTAPFTVFDGALDLPRVSWEGGPAFYEQFAMTNGTEWTQDTFFPIGYWGAYCDAEAKMANNASLGINFYPETYAMATGWQQWMRNHGIYSFTSGNGSEWVSRSYIDETDMWAGYGFDPWTGNIGFVPNVCNPDDPRRCGYTIMNSVYSGWPTDDGRMHYKNVGKGALMWQGNTQRRVWINGRDGPDASANWRPLSICTGDIYFYSDGNIGDEGQIWFGLPAGEVRRAANYGELLMPMMRNASMADHGGVPQTMFGVVVELGGQATGNNINADQVEGAVWSTLIHEARVITYFSHVFAGTAENPNSSDVLSGGQSQYNATRARVLTINTQVKQLAPVLNTQSYQWTFNSNLSTMLKAQGGSFYIFAMQKRQFTSGSYEFTLPAGMPTTGTVEVMFESRTLPIADGKFTDSFAAEYSHHVYKITP